MHLKTDKSNLDSVELRRIVPNMALHLPPPTPSRQDA